MLEPNDQTRFVKRRGAPSASTALIEIADGHFAKSLDAGPHASLRSPRDVSDERARVATVASDEFGTAALIALELGFDAPQSGLFRFGADLPRQRRTQVPVAEQLGLGACLAAQDSENEDCRSSSGCHDCRLSRWSLRRWKRILPPSRVERYSYRPKHVARCSFSVGLVRIGR